MFTNIFQLLSSGKRLRLYHGQLLSSGKRLRLYHGQKHRPTELFMSALLQINCFMCLNGTSATPIFNVMPPTFEEYLPPEEHFEPDPTVVLPEEYTIPVP
jgi:hypothetical protein